MLRGHSANYMWAEIENLQEATGIELEMLASHWAILNNRLEEAEAELGGVVQRTDAEIEQLETELANLRERLWRHGDKCAAECSPACNATHTYQSGCWFAPTAEQIWHT